jgi:hypothetical protein
MLEQEAINASIDHFIKRKIMELIDAYAEEFDEILKGSLNILLNYAANFRSTLL